MIMSAISRTFLIAACAGTVGMVGFVHYLQQIEREQLHLGVVRDEENQERRKKENMYILQQQNELERQLKREVNSEENPV